jgi:hypothetical protein
VRILRLAGALHNLLLKGKLDLVFLVDLAGFTDCVFRELPFGKFYEDYIGITFSPSLASQKKAVSKGQPL